MYNENALTVSELNEYVRKLLSGDVLLRSVTVTGEISGYKHHFSGHRYFSLKDSAARVQCVMFKQNAFDLKFTPKDGMQVKIKGSASVFPRDGAYQIYVSSMEENGTGSLYLKFEELKRKLEKEGLFDPAIKRDIPTVPKCIGIVTSSKGAAVHDIMRIARRRNPNIDIIVAPCAVQGTGASAEIAAAIKRLNDDGTADVLLIGRGGGSMEDLWPFNEEVTARAIAASKIPTISCVGHETDFTIADFVSDVRAATPSMAAEIAVPVVKDLHITVERMTQRIRAGISHANDMRRLQLERVIKAHALNDPKAVLIEPRITRLDKVWEKCSSSIVQKSDKSRKKLNEISSALRALNPNSVLDRGYAYVTCGEEYIPDLKKMESGQAVNIHMKDGTANAEIKEINGRSGLNG